MPGGWGGGKAPLTAWVPLARASVGKYHSGRIQGSASGCASPESHRHPESGRGGRNRACLQEVARPLVGALLEGCREAEPLCRGRHWEAALRSAPGKSWSAGQACRSRAISSAVPVGVPSGARCHMTASTVHVENGYARGGVYTWMVHCGGAPRARDAWSTPLTMSAAWTSTIPMGSTTIPFAGLPWRPRVCKATSVLPVCTTRSTAFWMFTLPGVVSSRIQP